MNSAVPAPAPVDERAPGVSQTSEDSQRVQDEPIKLNLPTLPEHLSSIQAPQMVPVLSAVIKNLPYELKNMKQIPCFEPSLYYGMLFGGIVSGVSLLRKRDVNGIKHGLYTFLGVSLVTWQYCRLKLAYTMQQGMEFMEGIKSKNAGIQRDSLAESKPKQEQGNI